MRKTEKEEKKENKHFIGTRQRHGVFPASAQTAAFSGSGVGGVYCHFAGETGEKQRQLHTNIYMYTNTPF